MRNAIDGSVSVFHPQGTGYDDASFVEQMEKTFSAMYGLDWRAVFRFSDYFEENLYHNGGVIQAQVTDERLDFITVGLQQFSGCIGSPTTKQVSGIVVQRYGFMRKFPPGYIMNQPARPRGTQHVAQPASQYTGFKAVPGSDRRERGSKFVCLEIKSLIIGFLDGI